MWLYIGTLELIWEIPVPVDVANEHLFKINLITMYTHERMIADRYNLALSNV